MHVKGKWSGDISHKPQACLMKYTAVFLTLAPNREHTKWWWMKQRKENSLMNQNLYGFLFMVESLQNFMFSGLLIDSVVSLMVSIFLVKTWYLSLCLYTNTFWWHIDAEQFNFRRHLLNTGSIFHKLGTENIEFFLQTVGSKFLMWNSVRRLWFPKLWEVLPLCLLSESHTTCFLLFLGGRNGGWVLVFIESESRGWEWKEHLAVCLVYLSIF